MRLELLEPREPALKGIRLHDGLRAGDQAIFRRRRCGGLGLGDGRLQRGMGGGLPEFRF